MSPLLPPISHQQMALPSLASPTPSLTPTLSSNNITPAPVSRREAGRQDWAQLRPPSFGGQASAQKTYGGGPFQSPPPPKNTYGGGLPYRTEPIPIVGKPWIHSPSPTKGSRGAIAHPQPRGNSGAIAHPPLWGSHGAIVIPNIGEAVEPLPIPNLGEVMEPLPIPTQGKPSSHCPPLTGEAMEP